MCPGPDILVACDRNRLIGGLSVKTRRLIPQPALIGPLTVAPVEQAGRVREPHRVHESDLRQAGELLPAAANGVGAPIEPYSRTGIVAGVHPKTDLGPKLLCLLR